MRYHKKFLFRVFIDGIQSAAFMNCSPIKGEVADIEVKEGGALVAHKEPGMVTFDDVTLERGVTMNRDLYDKWTSMFRPGSAEGVDTEVGSGDEDDVAFTMEIVEYGRNQVKKSSWPVSVAHVKAFETGGWDNSADEAQVEKLTLRINYPELNKG